MDIEKSLEATLRAIMQRAAEAEAVAQGRPCWQAPVDGEDRVLAGAEKSARCLAAGSPTCDAAESEHDCPRRRMQLRAMTDLADRKARITRTGMPRREQAIVIGKLLPTDALLAVQRALGGGCSFLALAGDRGNGKTVAACYALAKRGGTYLTAYQLSRPGVDLDAIKAGASVLVVDQLGRENVGASGFFLAQLEELVDAFYASQRLVILVGNLRRPEFEARYQGIIADRLRGDGEFVWVEGASLRLPGIR